MAHLLEENCSLVCFQIALDFIADALYQVDSSIADDRPCITRLKYQECGQEYCWMPKSRKRCSVFSAIRRSHSLLCGMSSSMTAYASM